MLSTTKLKYLDKKILPMTMPLVTIYPNFANELSVISSYPDTFEWIISNFIQVVSRPYSHSFGFQNYIKSPFITYQQIKKDLVMPKWDYDISAFLIDCLNREYYVFMLVDVSKLPVSSRYKSGEYYSHDIFIYGYDLEQQLFYIADHFTHGKYAYETQWECPTGRQFSVI